MRIYFMCDYLCYVPGASEAWLVEQGTKDIKVMGYSPGSAYYSGK